MQRVSIFNRPVDDTSADDAGVPDHDGPQPIPASTRQAPPASPPAQRSAASAPAPAGGAATVSRPAGGASTQGPTLMQRIKDKLPLLEFVKRYTEMKASPGSAGEFFGKCIAPDHDDKGPSFYVNAQKNIYHCKGCGISGNVVGAYAIVNNMADDDAKFALGRELGVFNERRMDDAESLLAKAAGRFAWALERKEDALAYLTVERKLTPETIKRFGLGFCWGSEYKEASQEVLNMALEAGLIRQPDPAAPGKPPRTFMGGRITFPVKDRSGRIVGFAGRLVPSGFKTTGPKYINSPETKWFHKSELLYGANEANSGIARSGYAVVVEGYMDVCALHQCGADNAVAVMGASANERTFESLWAMTKRVVFCLDGDAAGDAGALRSVLAAAPTMQDGCEIAIARLPAGVDPDEFVLEHGGEAFSALCERATPLSRFLMIARSAGHELGYPEGRARFMADAHEVAGIFVNAPLVRDQIVAEARAINAAALVDVALDITGLAETVTAQELRDAIALMNRRLNTMANREGATPAAPRQPLASRPR